jgi:hypothetical protein
MMMMRVKILIMIRDRGSCVGTLYRRFSALGELDQWQVLDCTIIVFVFLCFVNSSTEVLDYCSSTWSHTIEAICLNFPWIYELDDSVFV